MTMDVAEQGLGAVAALALVLGLAWAGLLLLKMWQGRLQGGAAATNQPGLRFVRALPLGPRERVVLIELGSGQYLLGVTSAGISLLAEFPAVGEAGAARPLP